AAAADDVCHGRLLCPDMDRADYCEPAEPGVRARIPDSRGRVAVLRVTAVAHGIPCQRTGAAPRHAPIAGNAAGPACAAMGGESGCRARPGTRARRRSALVRLRAAAAVARIF